MDTLHEMGGLVHSYSTINEYQQNKGDLRITVN